MSHAAVVGLLMVDAIPFRSRFARRIPESDWSLPTPECSNLALSVMIAHLQRHASPHNARAWMAAPATF